MTALSTIAILVAVAYWATVRQRRYEPEAQTREAGPIVYRSGNKPWKMPVPDRLL